MNGDAGENRTPAVVAHQLALPPHTGITAWFSPPDRTVDAQQAVPRGFVHTVSGSASQIARVRGCIPTGVAAPEAIAVRLRRSGVAVRYVTDGELNVRGKKLVAVCRDWGQHTVLVWRADRTLLPELRIGSWFGAGWRTRLLRRAALSGPVPIRWFPPAIAADAAYWAGVRRASTPTEWRRLTSSYVVLLYHRLAGLGMPGQVRWDVSPAAFRRHLRMLGLLGWRPLTPTQLRHFHADPHAALPRRRYVITADDGFDDAIRELAAYGHARPQVFLVTRAVGGTAEWFGDTRLADWNDVRSLRESGGAIGSHARHHVRLADLADAALGEELAGSLSDLTAQVSVPVPMLAYPHGSQDARVREATIAAGYALAYTTQQGRNGAGTDRWSLRRIEPKIWDTTSSFLWKVITGESPPVRWERSLKRRWGRRRTQPDDALV